MAEDNKNVRLVSVEGESYEVPLDVAKMSELVKNMIDDVSNPSTVFSSFLPLFLLSFLSSIFYIN